MAEKDLMINDKNYRQEIINNHAKRIGANMQFFVFKNAVCMLTVMHV
jgi:hypothetical protein